jgi:uncharacterized protein (TIGR04255 family)
MQAGRAARVGSRNSSWRRAASAGDRHRPPATGSCALSAELQPILQVTRNCTINMRLIRYNDVGMRADNMPGLQLPAPDTRRLERSPLELVVCQIRHERNIAVADAKRAFRIRDGLGGKYPSDEEATGLAVNITGGATGVATATDQQQGWNFKSDDGTWTVALMPDFFALETRAYTGWDEFSSRLDEVVRQVEEVLSPDVERRVGLRFIDRITDPKITSPTGWKGWINDSLLGPILHEGFGPAVKSIQQVLQLDGGDDMGIMLRHGCLVEGPPADQAWHYLLDHDCSRSRSRAFSADSIRDATERLHELALSVFQASITPKLHAHLLGDDD